MIEFNEISHCVLKINPDAKFAACQNPGEEPYIRWEDSHTGAKPTITDCEAVLPEVRAEIAKEKAATDAKVKLEEIDIKSIRSIREWVAKQADAPQFIKDYESQAQVERAKLK
jgi:hypothetical protein